MQVSEKEDRKAIPQMGRCPKNNFYDNDSPTQNIYLEISQDVFAETKYCSYLDNYLKEIQYSEKALYIRV